jgi:hypothetical protein
MMAEPPKKKTRGRPAKKCIFSVQEQQLAEKEALECEPELEGDQSAKQTITQPSIPGKHQNGRPRKHPNADRPPEPHENTVIPRDASHEVLAAETRSSASKVSTVTGSNMNDIPIMKLTPADIDAADILVGMFSGLGISTEAANPSGSRISPKATNEQEVARSRMADALSNIEDSTDDLGLRFFHNTILAHTIMEQALRRKSFRQGDCRFLRHCI